MNIIKPAHAQVIRTLQNAHRENVPKINFDANIAGLLSGSGVNILNLIFFGVGMIFFANLLYAAYEYITAGGTPQNIQAATKRLTNALLGIAIVIGSYIIVRIAGSIIGVNNLV